MRQELLDSYASKFDDPMTAYLYGIALDGMADESTGNAVDWHYHADRIGRRIVVEQSNGFVSSQRFDSEAEATEAFAAMEAEYAEYADEWEV